MKYKIWLYIEEIDEETDHYEDVMEPESVGGEFDSLEEAKEFRQKLLAVECTEEEFTDPAFDGFYPIYWENK